MCALLVASAIWAVDGTSEIVAVPGGVAEVPPGYVAGFSALGVHVLGSLLLGALLARADAKGPLERVASARDIGALYDLGRRRLPARARSIAARAPAGDLDAALGAATQRLADAQYVLEQRYAYDLVERNCITELVRITDQAFESAASTSDALGGRIAPGEPFGFVPFVFFDDVRTRLRVSRVEHVPSFRERELARLKLDAIRQDQVVGQLDAAERQALSVLNSRQEALRQ